MSQNSSIEWCEATWNCLAGCTEISPGCLNCYAAVMAHRLAAMGQAKYQGTTKKLPNGKVVWTGVVNLDEESLRIPLKRKKPTTYFVNSMSDLFHENVPDEFIDKVFAVMNSCTLTLPISGKSRRWHTFQVLTKRASRMHEYMDSRRPDHFRQGKHPWFEAGRGDDGPLRGMGGEIMNAGACLQWPLPNVWLGVSAEDQKRANERIPELLQTSAAVRFVSYEPAVGPVDFSGFFQVCCGRGQQVSEFEMECCNQPVGIDWVIGGCESGHGRRPSELEWFADARARCAVAGVAYFQKQIEVGGKVEHELAKFPESVRCRQYPKTTAAACG